MTLRIRASLDGSLVLTVRAPEPRWVLIHDDGGLCGCDPDVRARAIAEQRDDHLVVEADTYQEVDA